MPIKNNIELCSGQLYYIGIDESLHPIGEVSEVEMGSETEWADEYEPLKLLNTEEVTIECNADFNREWTLAYCRACGQPFPITMFNRLLHDEWTCPLCATIAWRRERLRRLKH